MKVNWCKFFIHKWEYNNDRTFRTCLKCKVEEQYIFFKLPLPLFSDKGEWETVPKDEEK